MSLHAAKSNKSDQFWSFTCLNSNILLQFLFSVLFNSLFFLQRYQINNYLCEMFLCINDNDKITQEREQTKKSYTIIYNLKHCHFSIPLKFQYHPIHQSPPIGGLILHSDTLQHKLTKC